MNIILIDVFENTVRRHGSFNPVSSENQYTRLKFIFKEGDVWDGCTAVTASFFLSADNVVSKVEEMGEDLTVTFPIPAEFTGQNGRLYVGIQGTYVEGCEIKTVSTNIIAITRATGAIVGEGVEQSLWEQLMAYLYENRFDRTVFEKKFGTIVSVTAEGVKNDGTLTDLGLALKANAADTVYYFPKGTYRINGFSFNGAENVTILAPEAKFIFDGTGLMTALIELKNCNGMKLIGGEFDGDGKAQTGIQLNNTPNSVIRDVFVHNIGNAELEYTAGIDAVNDCSHIILDNVRIDGVHAGRVTATGRIKIPGQDEYVPAGYIFATGIRIHNGSSGISKDILINHPVINDVGYLGEGNNKVNYVSATKKAYTYTDGGQQYTGYIYCTDDCLTVDDDDDSVDERELKENAVVFISDVIMTEGTDDNEVNYARIDGDGIHIAQRPDEMIKRDWYEDEGKSYTVIRNPQITNCAKRALKIAARCVEVDGGNIDVSTWATAVGFQFTDDSAIRNTRIHNGASTCLTVIADGRMTVENCAFSSTNGAGNGLAMTLEAQFSDAQDNPIAPLPENLLVKDCLFKDVDVPIIANLTSYRERAVDSNSVRIEGCEIGHFKGEAAIYLSPSRFNSIKSLVVRDNIFTHGSSAAEIHAANVERYDESCAAEQGVLYIGTAEDGGHVDPSELLEVDNPALSEDFDEVFRLYRFTAARRYLGGSPARADWVYDYPELLKLDAKSQTTEDSITYSVDNNGVISVSAAEASTLRKVWIPLKEPIVFNGNEVYELIVTPNKLNNAKVSVRLYTTNSMSSVDNMITIAGLNNLDRHVIISDTSKTATYLAVVCSPESGSSVGIESGTEFAVSLKSRTPIVKGLNRIDDCYTKTESDGRYLQSHQSLSNYYNKTEVDTALSGKADTGDIPTVPTNVSAFTNDAGYLTSHQSLSNYYNKTESDARYLQSHQDISGKADKATTLSGYGITDAYTKAETGNAIKGYAVPDHWASALSTAVGKVKAIQRAHGADCINLVWFSDIHLMESIGNRNYGINIPALAAALCDSLKIPFVLSTGDAATNSVEATEAAMRNDFNYYNRLTAPIADMLINCYGNHDGAWGDNRNGSEGLIAAYAWHIRPCDCFNDLIRRQTYGADRHYSADGSYGYIDLPGQKLRIVQLNSFWVGNNDTYNQNGTMAYDYMHHGGYGQEQLDWLAEEALSFDEDGWNVIFMAHMPPAGIDGTDYLDGSRNRDAAVLNGILWAYANEGTYTGSYSYNSSRNEGTWANVSVSVDFSGISHKAYPVAFLAGHCHKSRIDTTTLPFPIVTITCASNSSYDSANEGTRTLETATESALDILSICKDIKTLYLTRLGVGEDRSISYQTVMPVINQVPVSTDDNGNVYNGTGYKDGYRFNSSNAETAASGYFVTGRIPVTEGSVVKLSGFIFPEASESGGANQNYCRVMLSGTNKTTRGATSNVVAGYDGSVVENNHVTQFKIDGAYSLYTDAEYIRISGYGSGANAVITVE